MRRALELLGELCGGKAGGVSDAFPKGQAARSIRCNEKGCAKLTGITVTRAQYAEILARLHCTVRGASVLPPADRTDLALPEDIYEEIARIVGYEAVRPEPLRITLVPPEIDGERAIEQAALEACVRAGCIEARNYALDATGAVALENPVSADHAYLRQSLMPHLMAACARNLRHEREVRLCEAGRVFLKRATHEPAEKAMIGAAYGAVQSDAEYGVRVVRGIIDALCASLAVGAWSYEEADEGLAVIIGGERAGTLAWRTEDAMCICAAEIARDALARHARKARYAPAPKYPAIVRDISFIVPRSVRAGALLQAAERAMPAHCSAIEYIGAYADDRLPANARSITIRLVFRSAERTLTDREAEEGVSAVANTLKTQFGIETR
jgi:phenylalanyl-tRNA synthetase beta chain